MEWRPQELSHGSCIRISATAFRSTGRNPTRNSRLYKAVTYIQNRRPYLETYLEDGRCSFSNNASERSVKPYVLGRKNWLFHNTPSGAEASEKICTLIEVAKANGVNVYHYLCYLMEKVPS